MRRSSSGLSSARSAAAICSATSDWMAKMSVSWRSYVSAQRCRSVSASISWATIRTRSPTRRTLPSSRVAAESRAPISRRLWSRFLNIITEVREMTLSDRIFESCAMTSSVIPSAKYSFSGSPLRLRNGSTATERAGARTASGRASAAANSATEAYRSAGTWASAVRMACSTPSGTLSRTVRSRGTVPTTFRAWMAWAVAPVNGGSPASISYSTQPSE